jgi:cytochrome c5
MADNHAKMTQATPQEVIISVIAGLFAPLLAIFLIVQLVLGIQDKHPVDTSSEAAQKATLSRIKPFAQLVALDANAPKVEKSGQEVFDAVCTSCHTPGALGAPKFNNKGDWAGRLGQGYDTLVKHAIEGIRQMPPRGGDGDLSDVEVARAVIYMANSGGASFKEPEAAAPAATAAAGPAKPDPAQGKGVYDANCAACHGAGIAGAPKFGDKAAWKARLAGGFDALYGSALKGKGAMPAKGGNADLPDADLAHAVAYMMVEAGGKP